MCNDDNLLQKGRPLIMRFRQPYLKGSEVGHPWQDGEQGLRVWCLIVVSTLLRQISSRENARRQRCQSLSLIAAV
jgi:hypothetical protein